MVDIKDEFVSGWVHANGIYIRAVAKAACKLARSDKILEASLRVAGDSLVMAVVPFGIVKYTYN